MRLTNLVPIVLALSCSAGTPTRAAITTFGGVRPAHNGADPWLIAGQQLFVDDLIYFDPDTGLLGNSFVSVTAGSRIGSGSGRILGGASILNRGGSVILQDAGSRWNIADDLSVEGGTFGGLTVRDNAIVQAGDNLLADGAVRLEGGGVLSINALSGIGSEIGTEPDSVGLVTVTDPGSAFQSNGFLRVGAAGTGTLTISDSGRVENSDGAAIGRFPGSTGTATVTGNSSSLVISANLAVGQEGAGTLIVEDRGRVSSTTGRVAATSSDSVGMVTITGDGSRWTLSDFLRIGESGEGTLTISDGGRVSVGDSIFLNSIGGSSGSNGSVTVTGAGSTWSSNNIDVGGDMGTGSLTIADGGSVATSSSAGVGVLAGTTGTATVTGEGSIWTQSGFFSIGARGNGTLRIEDGGSVANTTTGGSIATDIGPTGTATITGEGSTWTQSSALSVDGMMTIEAGASVSTRGALIAGFDAGSTGAVTVTGAGSIWNSANLVLGSTDSSSGTLTIEASGSVVSDRVDIGSVSSATGTVTVTGAGSTWTISGNLLLGLDGAGTLTIGTGGTVSVAEEIFLISNSSILELDGGTLTASTMTYFPVLGARFEFLSGTLHVDVFEGPLVNLGGTLAPGESAGSTTVVGNYLQFADAVLEIEIGGLTPGTQFDVLTIEPGDFSGDATLFGALEVSLIDNFVPALGDTFTIVETTTGTVDGAFENEILPVFNGLTFDVVIDMKSVVLEVIEATTLPGDYNQNGIVDAADYTVWRDNLGAPAGTLPNDIDGGMIGQAQYDTWVANFGATAGEVGLSAHSATSAVPEPGTWLLLATALAGLGVRCQVSVRP